MRRTAAIILAAGKGTRMNSDKPKVIFTLQGKELINWVVDTALSVACDPVVIVVGYKKEIVKAAVPENPIIHFAEQNEQHGTGHAVQITRDYFRTFRGDIFILCGDVPLLKADTLREMQYIHHLEQAAVTLLTAKMEDPQRYGRIERDNKGSIIKIVEYKDASEQQRKIREINTGIYCFDAEYLFSSLNEINNDNAQSEYYLTDTLEILHKQGRKLSSLLLADNLEASGVNSQSELLEMERSLNIIKKVRI
ncbi:MAG: NTP transferase domain-containing protein [Candidatus Cloacimonetes bacterium]|nr:NTP transferase domain-containing protein [Candidatus Cloacimonadota bacterium]